ncbi:MAG TPA: NADH-quinone oxidoreductase subunit L [Verrucomicrobiae bacterium]|nr:NADH-quinone oxidoreductase subunit L [Verrucomicrobiae bacterium]
MSWILKNLWLIAALPMLAAGLTALAPRRRRRFAASAAIASITGSLLLSLCALSHTMLSGGGRAREVFSFPWFQFGTDWLTLGWVLDPLSALMLVMVSFVGLLIFIYSIGYMAKDENFTRFFCFLSLFAGAMLGLVISNSLLLLFMCWELVGLTSYLLIGFWYHKPSAAAAAKKAFITTRIGDIAFLIGLVWLYAQSGTLLCYDAGRGCLETTALGAMAGQLTTFGVPVAVAISLLIFCGAMGKSGQVPLHVWLPDAMEGPTPVSALIHAATMVAAGVFLVARVFPLMAAGTGTTLTVITWVGAITAIFAAGVAVAQTDIKRILAYSTVSQLGYMMMGLGTGGVAVGMFHLITHAFFKALLFLGAGSVIHGCHEEQDVRCMGGLRKWMPVTFATYSIGMLSLSGFPLLFSGFWSKDAILHAAHNWTPSSVPFFLGLAGAFLTAFYMTRQVALVFFGNCRLNLGRTSSSEQRMVEHGGIAEDRVGNAGKLQAPSHQSDHGAEPHESPAIMTAPLVILAIFSIAPAAIGTPFWPWFQKFLGGETGPAAGIWGIMLASSAVVFAGLGAGWWLYGRKPVETSEAPDVLERLPADLFVILRNKFWFDEIYDRSIVAFTLWWSRACNWLDAWVWNGLVQLTAFAVLGLSWLNRACDEYVVNLGFDEGCNELRRGGRGVSRLQDGQVQHYLRAIGLALAALGLMLIWGCK